MEAFEKLKKAQIMIQSKNPFFSYLSLFIRFREVDEDNPALKHGGMGVAQDGELIFKKSFVDKCSDEELKGVLCHEILHLAFLHLTRRKNRHPEMWNIAVDCAVNSILQQNNFQLPKVCILPDKYNDTITLFGRKIEEVSKKTAEKIYDELPKVPKVEISVGIGTGQGKGQGQQQGQGQHGFDVHIESKGMTEEEKEQIENDWLNRLDEAITHAKQKGSMPMGMDRWIDKLHKSKVNWRTMLKRYVQNEIPMDYDMMKCSKKGIASGNWLPNTIKEKIDVVVVADLSGSIGDKEMRDFLSEIVGMAKAYQSQIDMRFLTHDAKINDDMQVRNGNIAKILKCRLHGGGGTDFDVVFKYMKEKRIKPKVLIWLTDGYGTKVTKQNFNIIWCLTKNSSDNCIKNTGVIIKLEDED